MSRSNEKRGQTAVEYLLLATVAVATVGAIAFFVKRAVAGG